jgi:hypothetical protein
MQKSKKNVVGLVEAYLLLSGVRNWVNKDLDVKIVAFYLPETIANSNCKIGLYGLKNGYWNGKPSKPLAVTATYRLIHCSAFFILSCSSHQK